MNKHENLDELVELYKIIYHKFPTTPLRKEFDWLEKMLDYINKSWYAKPARIINEKIINIMRYYSNGQYRALKKNQSYIEEYKKHMMYYRLKEIRRKKLEKILK